MQGLDWAIVAVMLSLLVAVSLATKQYMRSVADFLVANRCLKRYLITITMGAISSGALSFLAFFEMYYTGGFVMVWWSWPTLPIYMLVAVSGWVVVRYRQTRVMTPAQFFELRYDRTLRCLLSALGFACSVIAGGIVPGVAARFFIYFCGLPVACNLGGLSIPTQAILMFVLIAMALFFVFVGGQVVVLITDALQGMFCNLVLLVIMAFLAWKVNASLIYETLIAAPAGQSLTNPFDSGQIRHFNVWFILTGLFLYGFYNYSTSPSMQSSKNSHEARMGNILSHWRSVGMWLFYLAVPVVVYTVLHHPSFAALAAKVNTTLGGFGNSAIQSQMICPLTVRELLPTGLVGCFAAMMLAAFISSQDIVLQGIGTGLVQDVILPWRQKPWEPKQHMRLLRWSIIGAAAVVFLFSCLYNQTQHLLLFSANVGAIGGGGIGAITIGGLYWRKGTTAGAYASIIVAIVLGGGGFALNQVYEGFIIDGQWCYFITAVGAGISYIAVSLLTYREDFNLDKMLHRGKYALAEESAEDETILPGRVNQWLAVTREFTRGDKLIYGSIIAWGCLWATAFAVTAGLGLTGYLTTERWTRGWITWMQVLWVISAATTVWFTVGGILDLRSLVKELRSVKRNNLDNGMIVGHANRDEAGTP